MGKTVITLHSLKRGGEKGGGGDYAGKKGEGWIIKGMVPFPKTKDSGSVEKKTVPPPGPRGKKKLGKGRWLGAKLKNKRECH